MVEPLPSAAPVTFEDGAADHAKVVPDTFLGEGRILINAVPPLQIVTLVAVAEGSGLTVTTKSTGSPSHPLKAGIILYVTVPATLPLFCGASTIEPLPLAVTEAATIGPVTILVQEYVVPTIVDVGTKFNASLLHICCDKLTGLFVMTGTGFTVTITG